MKRNTHKKIFIAVCTLLTLYRGNAALAQNVTKVGTAAATFLKIPVGAKAIAMGSAFTAVADDGSATFWNPGNITAIRRSLLMVHYSSWLPGLEYGFISCTLPLNKNGVFGINVISLGTDEMEVTTVADPMGTGESYTAGSNAVGFSYGRSLTDRFSIGTTLKIVQERIYHCSATGIACDIGTMFVTPFRDIRLGVSVSNVGTDLRMNGEDLNTYADIAPSQDGNNDEIVSQLKTGSYSLPVVLRIGLAWDWRLSQSAKLTLACDGVNPSDDAQSLDLGFNLNLFRGIASLRGGFNELFLKDREKGLTLGAGLAIPVVKDLPMVISYAFQEFKHLGPVSHYTIEIAF
jgi:hypothetical protein